MIVGTSVEESWRENFKGEYQKCHGKVCCISTFIEIFVLKGGLNKSQ